MIVYQTPSPTAFQSRRQFHAAQKSLHESISDWFKRLQKFIGNCDFEHVSDYMLIDKFISGLSESDFEKITPLPFWTVEELVLVVIGNAHIFNTKEFKECQQLQASTQSQGIPQLAGDQLADESIDNRNYEDEFEDIHIKTELTPIELNDSYFNETNEDTSYGHIEADDGQLDSNGENTSTSPQEKTRLSNCEKNRRHIAKLRETGRYDEYKRKQAKCVKQWRSKIKQNEKYLPPEIQLHVLNERRRATRERVKRWRDRKLQKMTGINAIEKIELIESFDANEAIEPVVPAEPSIVWVEPEQFHEEEKAVKPKSKSSYVRKRTFQCYICSLDCSKLYELKTHLNLFHPSEKPEERAVLECPHCPKTTISRIVLSRHLRKCHGDLRLHKCPCCNEEFTRRGQLDQHIPQYHPDYHKRFKPFICEQCGSSFRSNSELKSHYRRHTGQKNFKCGVCGLSLASSSSLANHSLIHSDERPYECKECGKSFRQTSSLRKHMISIHNPEQKAFVCTTENCGKRFASIYHLRLHSYSHTGARPFRCDQCGSDFSQPTTLKLHIRRIHEKEQNVPTLVQPNINQM